MSNDKFKKPRALLGLHDYAVREMTEGVLESQGYEIVTAENLSDMVSQIEAQQTDSEENKTFDLYVMDANLGQEGEFEAGPAVRVYRMILPQVQEGYARLVTVTGNPNLHNHMRSLGIEAILKVNAPAYFRGIPLAPKYRNK